MTSDSIPIKRGTARRLGLDLPEHYMRMRLEFEVEPLREMLRRAALPPLTRWQEDFWSRLGPGWSLLPPAVD